MTNQGITTKIQKELLANPSIDTEFLAKKYGVSTRTIGANRTIIKRGLAKSQNPEKFIETTNNDQVTVIDKVTSIYKEAQLKGQNTYSNHNGENKENARNKMTNYIVDSGVIGTIASLPNTEWAIEQKIDNQISGNDFIGVECDEPTFIKMKSNLKNLKIKAKTVLGFIGSIIYGKVQNTYAHLILDYCGNLVTFCKEIEYVISNDVIKVGGIMAITFSKPIRGTDEISEMIKGFAPINNTDDRCMSDKGVEAYFNKITGFKYQVLEFYYYADKKENSVGNGYPMTLVIIKRIK